MQNLIFSLNATLPVFLVMVVGYALGQLGFLPPAFCKASDRLTFKVTLPLMLFLDMGSVDILHDFRPRFVLFCFAATLAGISIATVGTTLPHAIGQPMTGRFPNVTHGESMAVVYPEFIRFSYKSCPSKFAAVARLLDRKLHVLPDMEAAAALEGALVGFMKRVGMYFSREALGVTDDKLDAIIADALTYGDTYVAPKTPTEEEMRRMLADAKTRA